MPGSIFWVAALNALQNSMMLRPRWPRAGPIGGDGFALPAGTCSLIIPTIFLAMTYYPHHPGEAGAHARRRFAPCFLDPGFRRDARIGYAMLTLSRPVNTRARPGWRGRRSRPRP